MKKHLVAAILGAMAMTTVLNTTTAKAQSQAPTQAQSWAYMVGNCQLYAASAGRYSTEQIAYDPVTKTVQGRSGAVTGVGLFCPTAVVPQSNYVGHEIPANEHGNSRGWGWTMSLVPGMAPLTASWPGGNFSINFAVLPAVATQPEVKTAQDTADAAKKKAEEKDQRHISLLVAALPPVDGNKRFTGRFEGTFRFLELLSIVRPFAGVILDYNKWQVLKSDGVPNVDRPDYENWNAETLAFQFTAGIVVNPLKWLEVQLGLKVGDWFTRYPTGVISQTQEGSAYGIPINDFHACAWGFDVGLTGKPLPWLGIRAGYSFGRNCLRMPVVVGPQEQGGYLANHDLVFGVAFMP